MLRYSRESFFYQQRKRSTSTRREKKEVDTQPVFIESILTFRPGAGGEEGLGNIRLRAKSAAAHRQRRPPSAASRKSSVWFPPIDPSGPHLTTTQVPLAEPLVAEEEEKEETVKQPNYKFNELKFASASILSNLNRRLEAVATSVSEIQLPESLVNQLILSFQQLVADTIFEKREWQTDCYRDYKPSAKKLFLTGEPQDEDPIRGRLEVSLNRLVKQEQDKNRGKKRKGRMSQSEKKDTPDRPLTAKSTISGISLKSEFSNVSDLESRADYDKLPPELRTQGPEILRHRRESKAPKPKLLGPRTRLEKFNRMRNKDAENLRNKNKSGKIFNRTRPTQEKPSEDTDSESTRPAKGVGIVSFSMGSKECADLGWIVHPSKVSDPEGFTLYQWATTRLQEAMRQREESYLTAKLRGEDGPLVVKYYSDPNHRLFRGSRQRASSFPLPVILSKLPPSVGTFSSHSHNEVFLSPGDGQILCLMLLPDGSGFCNYYSGRKAVSLSRKGDGSRGLFTVVFDDSDYNNMIAYFMPDGRVSCYHRSGGIHLLADAEGGLLMDEDGCITRQWSWPKSGERMPHSVSIQLNTHLILQCTGLYEMTLKFSCHGQMHRFPVGLRPEFIESEHGNESFWIKRSSIISSRLQSKLPFQSDTAKKMWYDTRDEDTLQSGPSTNPQSREAAASGGENRLRQLEDSSLKESVSGSLTKWNEEPSRKELSQYKVRVRSIVDEWLGHYRQTIGISPPSRTSLQTSCTNMRLMSSHGLRGHTLSRSSSRPPSHYPSFSTSLPLTPSTSRPVTPGGLPEECYADSRAVSPLENLIQRPKSHESPVPFKIGPAKPKPHPPTRFRPGCPIALHNMIVRNLHEMPQCRCDKRRISTIRDVEFDVFLKSHVPRDQLIIICVTSSRIGTVLPCQPLLESLHEKQNANRYAPCQQSGRDVFRILKYCLCSAVDDLNTSVPLLLSRHCISDGMFLMYMNSRLIGAYTGFNGYGVTKRDLLKQVQRSLENGRNGQYLPQDFKFSTSSIKLHSKSLWAYPVSGVLDEMISCTPSSNPSVSPAASITNGYMKLDASCHTGFTSTSDTRQSFECSDFEISCNWSKTDFRRED